MNKLNAAVLLLIGLLVLVLTTQPVYAAGEMPGIAIPVWVTDIVDAVLAMPEVTFLVSHIAFNVIVAVAAAIATGEFKFHKLGEFIYRKVLPFTIVLFAAKVLATAIHQAWLTSAVLVLLEAALVSNLVENLVKLGIPIPKQVVELVTQ